ncbi:hypothetical protein [Niabella ginsengisoli]|uniref:Beta-lactamase-inhibitor-like PepSY-like domain-containing protein n=1 Tax=Niabella ginsengisoli TaxID=522298 RepID=A0ABS9SNG9_9BACT|nr:hypothetical protein [Niabella ginsengisoli]MCH5599907.1 hypothetical protein [Niabella ginsengisoli]
MKSLILSAAVIFALTFNAAAAAAEPVNEKVLKTFSLIFKDVNNVSWSNTGKHFEAYFVANDIKTRALLDVNGNLIQTIRYYKEDGLPSNILYSIKKAHQGKDIWGVTEVSNHNGVNYRIVLKDDKSYTHINANSTGDSEVVKKYKRGDK